MEGTEQKTTQIKIPTHHHSLRNTLLSHVLRNENFQTKLEKLGIQNLDNIDEVPSLPFKQKKTLLTVFSEHLQQELKPKDETSKPTEFLKQLRNEQTQRQLEEVFQISYPIDLDLLSLILFRVRSGQSEFTVKQEKLTPNELINKLASGHVTPAEVGEALNAEVFKPSRMEIVTQRQSPNPLSQSFAEAVSNSIDAILITKEGHRTVGQWGRGIKMLLNFLETSNDKITITTKQENSAPYQIELSLRNGRYCIQAKTLDTADNLGSHGTVVALQKDVPLSNNLQKAIEERIKQRFMVIPSLDINVNKQKVNGREKIHHINGQVLSKEEKQGEINVDISPTQVTVQDNGVGMSKETLLSMFTPNLGTKTYREINEINKDEFLPFVDVFYKEGEEPNITLARNRELVGEIREENRLNLFSHNLIVDLGPLAQVSDAREGVRINENFQAALQKVVEIVAESTQPDAIKLQIFNSLTEGLSALGGRKIGEKRQEHFLITQKIINQIREEVKPIKKRLEKQGYTFLPNNPEFQDLKISQDKKTIFIDPLLFAFKPEKVPVLKEVNEFTSQTGKRLYLTEFAENSQSTLITIENGFILDEKVWEKIIAKKQLLETLPADSPERKEIEEDLVILTEALELRLNPVSTSYDPKEKGHINKDKRENRVIFSKSSDTTLEQIAEIDWPVWLTEQDKLKLMNELTSKYSFEEVGWYVNEQGEITNITTLCPLPDGRVLVGGTHGGHIMIYDPETNKIESTGQIYQPGNQHSWEGIMTSFSLPNGRVLIGGLNGKIMIYDPESNKLEDTGQTYKDFESNRERINTFFLSNKKVLAGGSSGKIMIYDPESNKLEDTGQVYNKLENSGKQITTFSSLPDGRVLIGGFGGKIMIYDPESNKLEDTGQILEDFIVESIYTSISLPDGRVLIGGSSGKIMIYDPESNKLEDTGLTCNSEKVQYPILGFSPMTANGDILIANFDRYTPVYNVKTNTLTQLNTYSSTEGEEIPMHFTTLPDKTSLLVGTNRGNVSVLKEKLFSLTKEQTVLLLEHLYSSYPHSQILVDSFVDFFKNKDQDISAFVEFLSKDEDILSLIRDKLDKVEDMTVSLPEEEKIKIKTRVLTNIMHSALWSFNKTLTNEEIQKIINNPSLFLLDFSYINPIVDKGIIEKLLNYPFPDEKEQDVSFLFEYQSFFSLTNSYFSINKNPKEREVFLDKLFKLYQSSRYRQRLKLLPYSEEELTAMFQSSKPIEYGVKQRGVLEFLKRKGGVLAQEISWQQIIRQERTEGERKDIFTHPVALSEVIYLNRAQQVNDWSGLVDRLNNPSSTNLDLEVFRQELLKEVTGQAVEEGVARREMIQNAVDAIKGRSNLQEGKIEVDISYTQDPQKNYWLIEKFSDNGTGIKDWLKFFVPGETTKDVGDFGFFGAGSFKIFEGVDKVQIQSGTGDGKVYNFTLEWQEVKGKRDLVITSAFQTQVALQGTTIQRFKKLSPDTPPELEAGIVEDDYIMFGGLIAGETLGESAKSRINIYLNKVDLAEKITKRKRLAESFSNFGEIVITESSLPPSVSHGIGLRMSDLDDRYLQYIPSSLRDFVKRKNLSIILPADLPLIKDRSKIANEEELFDPLSRKIAGMVIKLATQELIENFYSRTHGIIKGNIWKPQGFPDDWFVNPQYSRLYTSDAFPEIKTIIEKLNQGGTLSSKELNLLSQNFDIQSRLAMVLVALNVSFEKEGGNVETTSLWSMRLKQLHEALNFISDSATRSHLKRLLKKEVSLAQRLGVKVPEDQEENIIPNQTHAATSLVNFFLGKNEVKDVDETNLDQEEKESVILLQKLSSIFGLKLEVKANIGIAGYFVIGGSENSAFVCDRSNLIGPREELIELFVHEASHYIEMIQTTTDTPKEIHPNLFTHQVDGPFGKAYYQVCEKILQSLN